MARKAKKSKKKGKVKKIAKRTKKIAKRAPAKKAKATKKPRKAKPAKASTPPSVKYPGMMGDGTEEQNLNQPGNPKARIKKAEVDDAFGGSKK